MKKFLLIAIVLILSAGILLAAEDKKDENDMWPALSWSEDHIDKVMDKMKKDFDVLLKDTFKPEKMEATGFPVNVWEDMDNIYVEASVPGREAKDITVNVEDGKVLTIQAKGQGKEEEKGKNSFREEFYVGDLERKIHMPELVDTAKVQAKYENGILKITLPKKEKVEKSSVKVEVK